MEAKRKPTLLKVFIKGCMMKSYSLNANVKNYQNKFVFMYYPLKVYGLSCSGSWPIRGEPLC